MKKLLLLLLAGLTLNCLALFAQEQGLAVIPFDTPDPTAFESPDGSGVYVFTTAPGINITRSANLMDWQRCGRVFRDAAPEWAAKMVPGTRNIWAPDIVFMNDKYYLYYSVSTFGGQRSVIGVANQHNAQPG